jgi:hypothetical protein
VRYLCEGQEEEELLLLLHCAATYDPKQKQKVGYGTKRVSEIAWRRARRGSDTRKLRRLPMRASPMIKPLRLEQCFSEVLIA